MEPESSKYTFDMYTAVPVFEWFDKDGGEIKKTQLHPDGIPTGKTESASAVGICTGFVANDMHPGSRRQRERRFPFSLLENGISFKCSDGKASKPEDRKTILAAIGNDIQQQLLDHVVQGFIAAAGLTRALEAGGDMADHFMEAIKVGNLKRLELSLHDSKADTVNTMRKLVSALNCNTLQQLQITSAKSWNSAGNWLPRELGNRQFVQLTKINLFSKDAHLLTHAYCRCALNTMLCGLQITLLGQMPSLHWLQRLELDSSHGCSS